MWLGCVSLLFILLLGGCAESDRLTVQHTLDAVLFPGFVPYDIMEDQQQVQRPVTYMVCQSVGTELQCP